MRIPFISWWFAGVGKSIRQKKWSSIQTPLGREARSEKMAEYEFNERNYKERERFIREVLSSKKIIDRKMPNLSKCLSEYQSYKKHKSGFRN